ncbi:T9SS type A sorting domain-containing protein, partial [Flavobacterium psychrophilum]
SPAARQMLIEQLDGKHEASPYPTDLWSNTAPNGQNNNSPFRQQFQNNLNSNGLAGSNGYPQNLRKIALINGTTNGTKTNGEGNMFLELAAFTIIKYGQIFGTSIQTKLKVATIEDKFLSTPYSSSQTFAGKVTIKRVGGIEVQKGRVIRTNSNSRGSMDNVQGGTFNTQGIIKDEFTLALNDAVDSQEWRAYIPNHAFIPSVSSLAFKNPNFDWSTALNRNLVCDPNNKEIYFDSYFSPSKNEEHVFVSAENANWLIKELQGIPQAPSFPIQASLLTGPDLICNANTVYSFSDACKLPSTVTWSVSPNLQIVSSTSYSVTVSQISNGQGTITATFQNGQTVAKTIWVGKPSFYLDYRYFEPQPVKSKFCAVSDVPNYTLAQQGVTNVVYTTSNNVPISNWGGPYCFRETNLFCVNATATNTCGTTTITYECDFRKANANTNFYTIYPNPSNDIVNIEIRDANNIPEKRATITGELFDMMRQLKAKVEINNNKATFSVSGLNKGIYVLKIYINDKVESHQIAVE